LSYQVLAADAGTSLVLVRLHTGRTHQIRVQFASRKTPLLGDGKYGGGNGPLALWSFSLALPHPGTGKTLCFRLPPEGSVWERFQGEIAEAMKNTDVSDDTER
ncbi:MAG: RNA pseudouridine synthase, partial [Oscillospiraceae bacterium]|nr:RNA pseudouridine synthase [Oscillospiraceae bacterium]